MEKAMEDVNNIKNLNIIYIEDKQLSSIENIIRQHYDN
jgi:hypothetical protein